MIRKALAPGIWREAGSVHLALHSWFHFPSHLSGKSSQGRNPASGCKDSCPSQRCRGTRWAEALLWRGRASPGSYSGRGTIKAIPALFPRAGAGSPALWPPMEFAFYGKAFKKTVAQPQARAPGWPGDGVAGYLYRGCGKSLDGRTEGGHRATRPFPPLREPPSTMGLGSPAGIFWPRVCAHAGSWCVCFHRTMESLMLEKALSPTMNQHHHVHH